VEAVEAEVAVVVRGDVILVGIRGGGIEGLGRFGYNSSFSPFMEAVVVTGEDGAVVVVMEAEEDDEVPIGAVDVFVFAVALEVAVEIVGAVAAAGVLVASDGAGVVVAAAVV